MQSTISRGSRRRPPPYTPPASCVGVASIDRSARPHQQLRAAPPRLHPTSSDRSCKVREDGIAVSGVCGLKIGKVGDVMNAHPPLLQDPQLAAERRNKVGTVRDDDHAALEAADAHLQCLERVRVEVVGRLVKNEQVRLRPHGLREREPCLLPA
eukprot:6658969-Prymnesium_polylepis.3